MLVLEIVFWGRRVKADEHEHGREDAVDAHDVAPDSHGGLDFRREGLHDLYIYLSRFPGRGPLPAGIPRAKHAKEVGMAEQKKLEEAVEFSENPEPRCPCVLLLDTSGSMQGAAIEALNEGLRTFKETLTRDVLASRRVEVAIVTFDNRVVLAQDFVTADQLEPPTLTAQGLTHMGQAINHALDLVEARKHTYRANGVSYYRPWVFMITDGEPQGEPPEAIESAGQRIKALDNDQRKGVAFFAVGVEGANLDMLRRIVTRAPVKLLGLNFQEMFIWLSASMQAVSQSQVKDQVALPPPGWGAVT